MWAWVWQTPQAAAWSTESWRWAIVASYVRWSVRAEDRDCPASVLAQVHRLADQIGMTPAGLRENGWFVSADELAERRDERPAVEPQKPQRRLRAVSNE